MKVYKTRFVSVKYNKFMSFRVKMCSQSLVDRLSVNLGKLRLKSNKIVDAKKCQSFFFRE